VRHEQPGDPERAVDAGEGRTRFLVILSALSSLLFLISIVFTFLAFIMVPPCEPWF
jgi:hypothetical protein